MKKFTLLIFFVFSLPSMLFSQQETLGTATNINGGNLSPQSYGQNLIVATIYDTSHTSNQGAEITAAANGPNTSMGDAIVLSGSERFLTSVTVDLFNLASTAAFDLTMSIYSDCPSLGAGASPCGSGPGILFPGSVVTVAVTPGTLGTIYSVTFNYPYLDLSSEADNNITVTLNASRNDVFWRIGDTVTIGSEPVGEPGTSLTTRCGSQVANNGCNRNFGLQNNFTMTLMADSVQPPPSSCGTGNPQPIPVTGSGGFPCTGGPTTSPANISTIGTIGVGPGQYILDNVTINLTHTFDGDLDITLISPMGTPINLSSDNGGTGENYTNTVFMDGNPSITTGTPPYSGTFQAEGGLMNTVFAGQPINGNWTLSICDDAGGDFGSLLSYCINFSPAPIGDPPIIACPIDIMADTDPGVCSANVNFANAVAIDPEDGPIATTQTGGPASGSAFPVGSTIIEFSATDSDGNTSTCEFTVTVMDTEAPVAVCQDITVELDASGNATITAADIDNGSSDNCGIITSELGIGSPPFSGSLTTLFIAGNGGSNGGAVYFDVTVGPNDIDVTAFDINSSETGPLTMDVYSLVGTSFGNENNAGAWGAVDSSGSGTGAGQNNPTTVTLNTAIILSANTTYGFALVLDATHGHSYTNGNGGNQNYSNADLSMALGSASNTPFGSTFANRIFNGTIIYTGGGTIAFDGTFDCSNVGENIITLTVTDAEGNSSSCTSTVTIEDNIAPVLTCIGQPATVTDTATVSPNLPINAANSVVTSTLSVTDDFIITDLDVNLDIPHAWVGDLIVQIESPSGTVVVIMDQPGAPATTFGCAGDNILATLDDEATDPVENECDPGIPTINGSFIPNNPLTAFDGESTMGDWILTVTDTFPAGDFGTLSSWGITYAHDVSATPLDVILDANGLATVDPNDLLLNVDEACGYTITAGGAGGGSTETLTTTFAGGNGNFGNMFDLVAINELTIDSFDVNADAGPAFDVEVYVKVGTWVGSEGNPAAWTLLGTAVGVVPAGEGLPTPLNLDLDYQIPSGETHAFYVTPTDNSIANFNYTNGTAVGNVFAQDANLQFLEGAAKAYPFTGTTFSPRLFNGNIIYTTGGGAGDLEFDCSDLGENLIEVTVTDDSGNVSTCIATVNVIDETSPIITCAGPSIPTETGVATDSPALAIVDNNTVSTTITVTDDFPITDLNVALDVTHSWVADMLITLESPAGTQVLIYDGGADGCSGNNFNITLDDESVNPLVCVTGPPAFPLADYIPSNALSAFDGESTVGVWTLSIEDTAGGDQGTLNTWGLTYSYDGTPTVAYVIELGADGTATIDPADLIVNTVEACGIATTAADITEFDCDDIGAGIILVTVFVSDTSGNIASCVAEVIVVDNLGPEITCPADQTQDPGVGNLFYLVPDYFATGEATATDNCTDPVTDTTQDPVAGTPLPDGTYTITLTAEDEYGNVSTCTFELTVESILGVNSNDLNVAIAMYPNPARDQVTILNRSNMLLDNAVIFDINGKMVQKIDLRSMAQEKVIDVSALAAGVYVVQITGENSSVVKRLIKE